jgi:hypothetical protein
MKGKLIKTDVNYLLEDDKGVVVASTSTKEGINGLTKQNCDEIFGVVDVEKLAEESKNEYVKRFNNISKSDYMNGFEEGFNKAMELYQPTEIEVEIEMECLDPNCDGINKKGVCIPGDKPKLDSNECLILKKL